jgi:hypothetical protein
VSSLALFGINFLFIFVAWVVAVRRYVWPALRNRSTVDALRPILTLHSFRFVGLAFLIPGIVSPKIPADFARHAALGDFITAVLALAASAALPGSMGLLLVWAFNVFGAIDLLNAMYQGNRTHLDPGQLGAAYFIPTLLVPLLLVTHGLVFRLLLRRDAASNSVVGRRAA